MSGFEEKLEKYAELAVKNGVNIQKGQELVVSAPISAVSFVRLIAKKAYQAGAKHVHFRWQDDELTRTRFLYAPEESFEEFPEWEAHSLETLAKKNAAFLSVYIPNPELLKDIDPEKISKNNKVRGQALKAYSDYMMKDKVSWSLISVPSDEWAEKLFPDLGQEEAIAELWETIFKMTRADQDDPVAAWEAHKKNLAEKAAYLNNKKYKKLHYKAPGTDLSIEFHEKAKWVDASSVNEKGDSFIANIPTEEVYTLPLKTGVNGTVTSTMPLNYSGTLIEDLQLTFKDGKIVDYTASSGVDTLKHLVETDEGSHYLGEVALVPHNSPISASGLLFFNTLFDENASCHLAIGEAYPTTLEGGAKMSREELDAHGANDSLNHVDFMIGSAELDIDGELPDGTREPLMRNGLWAI
ncbi:aminopeptidase [Pullulanibacillus pueri]|uniref:Aminopeptidase n=1 Tax=Pullulanibacillus pueri TaxID=1437324 RepID=A0A8J2ZWC3_9BACL|nr:aminopeptidase [Pullulanibacillus pueri]MBM7682564.1 aminopeptidase [Pullulanibacillus pueri]GGH82317.1 aminopeptidase [Pullulanibacillus pueri]